VSRVRPSPGTQDELDDVVRAFRQHGGLLTKSWLGLVREILGTTDWMRGPGDDAAAIGQEGDYILAAGEAISPPFIETDPFGAGVAAAVTNVNDIAAMGGTSTALVDTVVAPEHTARRVLQGLRRASDLYGVPVVGGHLTVRDGPPAVSAFVVGRASNLLSARNVAPTQTLLFACCSEGGMRDDFPFFSSLDARASTLAEDVKILPQLARAGSCAAAKDISMAGFFGSLAMLLEPTRCGATVALNRVPRPAGVGLVQWVMAFPSFGFLLCAPPDRASACRQAFTERGLSCEDVGCIDASAELKASLDGHQATLMDLRRESVTRLQDEGGT
jgi:selenophosphate synthetase-related protein